MGKHPVNLANQVEQSRKVKALTAENSRLRNALRALVDEYYNERTDSFSGFNRSPWVDAEPKWHAARRALKKSTAGKGGGM